MSAIQVISQTYDGRRGKVWPARIMEQVNNLLVLEAVFQQPVSHHHLGEIPLGTVSVEYYWLDCWFNVFRFLKPDGSLRNYYCNICLPPSFGESTITYVDLDLDILVAPDGSWQILDEEEFTANIDRYGYEPQLQQKARAALSELITLIETRAFPFTELPLPFLPTHLT